MVLTTISIFASLASSPMLARLRSPNRPCQVNWGRYLKRRQVSVEMAQRNFRTERLAAILHAMARISHGDVNAQNLMVQKRLHKGFGNYIQTICNAASRYYNWDASILLSWNHQYACRV